MCSSFVATIDNRTPGSLSAFLVVAESEPRDRPLHPEQTPDVRHAPF